MTGRPDLRGRLRSRSELGQLVLLGPRPRRWSVVLVMVVTLVGTDLAAAFIDLPFALAVFIAAVVTALVGTALAVGLLSTEDAAIARWWMRASRAEWARWRHLTGEGRRIRTRRGTRAWLRRAPDRPEVAECRADCLLVLGDLDAARAEIARIPTDDPMTVFQAARLTAIASSEVGDDGDLALTRAALGRIGESADRRLASWQLTLERARQALVTTGSWREPFAEAAAREPAPGGRWPIVRVELPIAIAVATIAWVVTVVAAVLVGRPLA